MSKKLIRNVNGFVHDIGQVETLSDEANNMRLLSDRSLYLLQNLSGLDVTFLSRYGEILTGGYYLPVEEGSSEASTVEGAIDIIRRDLNDMSVEETLECICEQLQSIAASASGGQAADCACQIGSDVETTSGEISGPLPDPVNGVPYEDISATPTRKCKAANYIHQGVRDVVNELKLNRADQYFFAGLQFVLTLVTTVIGGLVAGPFGLLVGAVAGASLGMALGLFKASFSLTLLLTAITGDEQAAVCALFSAISAEGARSDYTDVLIAEGATSPEIEFVEYLLSNNVLNLLFFAWGDSEEAIDDVVVEQSCASCEEACGWYFHLDRGSGDLTADDSERTLTGVAFAGGYTCQIYIDDSVPTRGCGAVNRIYEVVSVSGWTPWVSASNDSFCRNVSEGIDLLWDNEATGDEPESGEWTACILRMSSTTAFTAQVILKSGTQGPCS